MSDKHSSMSWEFGDDEKVTITVPNSDWTSLANFYDTLNLESRRRGRQRIFQTWLFRFLIAGMLAGWWLMAFYYGNSYCK